LKKELTDKMDEFREKLEDLPPSISHAPQAELLARCNNFVSELTGYVNGLHPGFLKDLSEIYEGLATEITETKPNFEILCETSLELDRNIPGRPVAGSSTVPATPLPQSQNRGIYLNEL
jgi:hypothetical protein